MRITVNGKSFQAEAAQGTTLHSLLPALGYRLAAPCGGGSRCGKCRVVIANAPAPTASDLRSISKEDLLAGVRLACATAPLEGMDIQLEQTGYRAAHIATEGHSVQYPFHPQVVTKAARLTEPGLDDQRADLDRLAEALAMDGLTASPDVLKELPGALRRCGWEVTAALRGHAVIGLNPERLYGAAVDIGTTTLAAYLVDLTTGEEVAVTSALNPQKAWGDDVITRADHAKAGGLEALQAAVASEIDGMIGRLCHTAGVDRSSIAHVVVAGNTVMMHLFAGVSPEHIAQAPFTPAFTSAMELPAAALGLHLHPNAAVTMLPCVSGYVGADTVAGLLAAGMNEQFEPSLLIDIGTNGEIALAAAGKLFACSTAAGPAFEGAHIRCGMGGVAGAINTAVVEDGIRFTTIGGEPARGICGSGLLDLVAGLLDAGVIDETGRLERDNAPGWVSFDEEGIVIDSVSGVKLTARDIREVQLAKAAVAAGIDVLLAEAGIGVEDVKTIYLAGGFGSYLDKRSAGQIGLIPLALADKAVAIGNSSGAGAKAALLSTEAMEEAKRLAKAIRYIELSARQDFQQAFIEKMLF